MQVRVELEAIRTTTPSDAMHAALPAPPFTGIIAAAEEGDR
jgi:hypothetical protein